MTRAHVTATALTVVLLLAVIAAALLSQVPADTPPELGPFPTSDGDRVEITPRVASRYAAGLDAPARDRAYGAPLYEQTEGPQR